MKLDAIHHVAVIVSDYERAKEFYVGKLGFQVLRENYQARRGSYKLDLKAGNQELEVFYMLSAWTITPGKSCVSFLTPTVFRWSCTNSLPPLFGHSEILGDSLPSGSVSARAGPEHLFAEHFYFRISSGHDSTSCCSFYSTTGGAFFHCPF